MYKFEQFDIESVQSKVFVGNKIGMGQVLNREIEIHHFKIEPSKYPKPNNDQCIYMQIALKGTKHILFSASMGLLNQIRQVDEKKFPFTTTIIEREDKCLLFS